MSMRLDVMENVHGSSFVSLLLLFLQDHGHYCDKKKTSKGKNIKAIPIF